MKNTCCCCNNEFEVPKDIDSYLIKLKSCSECRKKAKKILMNDINLLIKAQAALLFGTVKDMYREIGMIK